MYEMRAKARQGMYPRVLTPALRLGLFMCTLYSARALALKLPYFAKTNLADDKSSHQT